MGTAVVRERILEHEVLRIGWVGTAMTQILACWWKIKGIPDPNEDTDKPTGKGRKRVLLADPADDPLLSLTPKSNNKGFSSGRSGGMELQFDSKLLPPAVA